jgi:hypothetical protein
MSSYFEEFLNGLSQQMNEAPSELDDPYIRRLMEARFRENQMRAMQERIAPGPAQPDTLGALITGLAKIYGGGASLALTGNTNPLKALSVPGMQVGSAGKAGHGANVRAELLAKRAAKGPRKPGGGRRPKAPPAPVAAEPKQDLMEALAQSVAKKPQPKGGLVSLLNRLGRRGGR